MINIFQYQSEEYFYLLCKLWAERVVYVDNLYGSLVNRKHVQFGQILTALSFYILKLFHFFYVKY